MKEKRTLRLLPASKLGKTLVDSLGGAEPMINDLVTHEGRLFVVTEDFLLADHNIIYAHIPLDECEKVAPFGVTKRTLKAGQMAVDAAGNLYDEIPEDLAQWFKEKEAKLYPVDMMPELFDNHRIIKMELEDGDEFAVEMTLSGFKLDRYNGTAIIGLTFETVKMRNDIINIHSIYRHMPDCAFKQHLAHWFEGPTETTKYKGK